MPLGSGRTAADAVQAAERVAVIDIGSNSIRLVVYDGLKRSPTPVFNEKVLCGLGRTVERSGKLSADGKALALQNMDRFKRLIDGMQVGRADVLATAAVRDAGDGAAFVSEVRRRTGFDVRIISGEEEARLSAMGVLSGTPEADGLMGDLGGGSLELVALDHGAIGAHATLPLGPLRLMELADGKGMQKRIDQHLDELDWLSDGAGRNFYPVGGSWRALAKIHMEQTDHPLHIIHHYSISGSAAADVAGLIARQSKSSLEKITGVSRRRLETLPCAALVMERLLRRTQPRRVIFSAFGLREGHLFSLLSPERRAEDPLLAAAADIAVRLGRFGAAEPMAAWMQPLFAGEDAGAARLRLAACLLSDISWVEHPDYRAEHAYLRVLRMPFGGIDHGERAFLALASATRYGGSLDASAMSVARGLISDAQLARATLLGAALRLAHTLTGGAVALLQRTGLRVTDSKVILNLPADAATLAGDVVQRRLDAVAKQLGGRSGEIQIQPSPRLAV